jgi:TPP-dependent 2-oxoacid decarboxylase
VADVPTNYTVADYLLDRLSELGVEHVFGVPGDFTLGLLDHVDAHPRVAWVGTANELGAGYAADGYARVHGLGVVCTTFGVGELSAINAVAGSYAEHVPVLDLVGAPATATQAARRPTHHSLGDGDFGHTLRMTSEVTIAQAALTADTATAEIDRVLAAIVAHGRPGYLSLPIDVSEAPAQRPAGPLALSPHPSDPDALERFANAARALLDGAGPPVVLADVLVHRAGAERRLHALLERGGLRYSSLLWGRRVIDESGPGFIGTYVGAASDAAVLAAVEDAERIITVGVMFTDLISGFFSEHLDEAHRIDLLPHVAVVAGTTFAGVELGDALDVLTQIVPAAPAPAPANGAATPVSARTPAPRADDEPLTQAALWDAVADALAPGDLVVADQGTSFYGLGPHHLPHDALFLGQPLWASIGYTLPAILGAAIGAPQRRPILLIGDGAAQLTIQELGTMLRHRIPAVVVVVNNAGYTVERAIHGATEAYNDIAPWRWTQLPDALGAAEGTAHAVRVETSSELIAALADARAAADRLTLIEAVTDPFDVPPLLVAVAQAAARANAPKG